MNLQEYKKELDNINLELKSVRDKASCLSRRGDEIYDILRASLMFSAPDITKTMAKLMTDKENRKYVPLIFDRDDFIGTTFFYAVSREDKEKEYKKKLYECNSVDDLVGLKNLDDFVFIYKDYYDDIDFQYVNSKENMISFDFLMDGGAVSLDIDDSLSIGKRSCNTQYSTTFDKFDYLYVFIEYLYDLQVINGGKKLSLEDMTKALSCFLNMDEKTYNIYKERVKILQVDELMAWVDLMTARKFDEAEEIRKRILKPLK